MKKALLLKPMFLLFALIVGSTSVALADDTYTKVTSENDLETGKTYIFVAKENTTYYLATGDYAKRLTAATSGFSVSSDGNTVTVTTATAFTVVLGGESGAYTLKMSNNSYLGKAKANTEFASSTSTTSTIGQYTWNYKSASNAFFSNYYDTGSDGKDHRNRYIGLNSDTPAIGAYNDTSTYPSVVLYKKVESSSSAPSSAFSFTMTNKAATIELPGTTTYTGAYTTASGYSGTISYELSNNTCGATINQSNGQVTVTQVGSVTVKGKAAAVSGSFSASEDTYTLTVEDNRQDPEIAWSSTDEVRIAQGASEGDYTLPTLSNPNNLTVTYSSTNEDVAVEIDGYILVDTDVLGSTTITATFDGDDDYMATSTSFKITVYDVKGTIDNPYTVEEIIALNPSSTSTAVKSEVYVKGFIIGGYNSSNKFTTTPSEYQNSNFVIASSLTETTNIIPIQVSSSFQTSFGIKNKSYNVGVAQVLIKGDVLKYFSRAGIKNVTEITKVAEKVNITGAGMATYYTDCALDFTGFEDMYAYTATAEGTSITYTRIRKVPAETALLLRNPSKSAASQLVPVITEGTETVSSNYLKGTLTKITSLATDDGNGGKNYLLNAGSNGVGFYWANNQELGVHKAYLNVPAGTEAPFFGFDFDDETTNIQSIERINNDNQYYTLDGRRVAQPTKGLYILNGRKVIVK